MLEVFRKCVGHKRLRPAMLTLCSRFRITAFVGYLFAHAMPEDSENPERELARMNDSGAQDPSDSELLKRIALRDETATVSLFDRYARIVYSVALRVLHDPFEAEDVMQEVLMQVWRGAPSFIVGRGSLGGWLAVVARNRAIDVLRRRHRRILSTKSSSPRLSSWRTRLNAIC